MIYYFPDRLLLSKHLGKILKKLRNNNNLKQHELAFYAQVSRNTISLIERGQISPSFDTLYRLCTVLEISLSTLITTLENSLNKEKELSH